MNTQVKKATDFLAIFLMAFFLFGATIAQAQDDDAGIFEDWNTNDDEMIDTNEFNEGFASNGYYDDWDVNDDALLDNDEFSEGLYDTWDNNSDGIIDNDEWSYGFNDEFGDEYSEFSAWDTDGNNEIDNNEFSEAYNNSGIYDDWNTNDQEGIDENEAAEGIFSIFDGDSDGFLGKDEASPGNELFDDNR